MIERMRWWDPRTRELLVLPAVVLVSLVVSLGRGGSGGDVFVVACARAVAVLLLAAVASASLEMDHRRQAFTRHDAIRADIAASGGLGKRLRV